MNHRAMRFGKVGLLLTVIFVPRIAVHVDRLRVSTINAYEQENSAACFEASEPPLGALSMRLLLVP